LSRGSAFEQRRAPVLVSRAAFTMAAISGVIAILSLVVRDARSLFAPIAPVLPKGERGRHAVEAHCHGQVLVAWIAHYTVAVEVARIISDLEFFPAGDDARRRWDDGWVDSASQLILRFFERMAAHKWKIRKVSNAGSGYKITAH
jgi:hypothetical protein